MLISIIIVNYNGKTCLGQCLDSVFALDFSKEDYEVIVVDNNSGDESWKIAEKYNDVKLIRNRENLGFAEGNNVGIEQSKGKYVVLFNNDLIVEKNWLNAVLPTMESDGRIGAIGGKIYYRKTKKVWFSGAKVYFGTLVNHKYLGDESGECDYIVGAAIMFRKSTLNDVGLFDEKLYLYTEDFDLCKRMIKSNYKVFYLPEAISYHMIKKNRASSYQEYYEQRNRSYIGSKDYPSMIWLFLLIDLIVLFQVFWLIRILRNPKKIGFWRETIRARVDSIKLILGKSL